MCRSDILIPSLVAEGVATDAGALRRLAETARARGISPVLIDVMVDDGAPIAPRIRAFGRISARVAALA